MLSVWKPMSTSCCRSQGPQGKPISNVLAMGTLFIHEISSQAAAAKFMIFKPCPFLGVGSQSRYELAGHDNQE